MKCLFIVGSANPNSVSMIIAKRLQTLFLARCQSIATNVISLQNQRIEVCRGCEKCFIMGTCPLDENDKSDSMKLIKDELMTADIIVFLSPIYFGNISGGIKCLFDRLAYWSHLMFLSGKIGIGIVVSDGNSYAAGLEYLSVVMESLGLSVVSNISLLRKTAINTTALDSVLQTIVTSTLSSISSGYFPITERQRMLYLTLAEKIEKRGVGAEYEYWLANELFKYRTFDELVKSRFNPI